MKSTPRRSDALAANLKKEVRLTPKVLAGIVILLLTASLAFAACSSTATCPVHDQQMVFTGEVEDRQRASVWIVPLLLRERNTGLGATTRHR